MESPAGGPMVVVSHPIDQFVQEQLMTGNEFSQDMNISTKNSKCLSPHATSSVRKGAATAQRDALMLEMPCEKICAHEKELYTDTNASEQDSPEFVLAEKGMAFEPSFFASKRSRLDMEIERLNSCASSVSSLNNVKTPTEDDIITSLPCVSSIHLNRKISSSFSDLGDYDEFTFTDVGSAGRNTPNSPFASITHSRRPNEEQHSIHRRRSLKDSIPIRDNADFKNTGIHSVAGELLIAKIDSAAYIIYYKKETIAEDTDLEMESDSLPFPSDADVCCEIGDQESRPTVSALNRSFSSLGAAGHKLQTGNCFARDHSHATRSLGRGLFRASTTVGNGFLKGAAGLVSQTYHGGASGGVFGFAKGLGMGMLDLGTHTVKGAFRGVGQVTNVVGEMVLGTAPHFSIDGLLLITNYRLIWTSQSAKDAIEIPIASILSLESLATAPHVLNIECKTLFRANLAFCDELICHDVMTSIHALFEQCPSYSFASVHRAASNEEDEGVSVHHAPFHTAEEEYERLGLLNSELRLYENASFQVFSTYPNVFIVPSVLSNEDLDQLCAYRSAGRIPAIVWRHAQTSALLARCAQPCAGLSGYAAEADIKMVRAIQAATTLHPGNTIHFFDARSQMAATANSAQGKGTEDIRNYQNAELHFCDIANIHAVRSSFRSLSSLCQPGQDRDAAEWMLQLQSTFWLMHIARILKAAQQMACCLCQGESVIVHCSDGWDRTAQLAALCELLLDPYYRTIQGFLLLMEKEWCSFGHRFRWRFSHGECPGHQEIEEQSPVFVQWLDSVWQIWRQRSWAFEFSDKLLRALYEHVYSGLYGNFLYNSQKERREKESERPTRSLWPWIMENRARFLNPEYDRVKNIDSEGHVLPFTVEEDELVLWDQHLAFADPVCNKYA